jgi:hypothetical protein
MKLFRDYAIQELLKQDNLIEPPYNFNAVEKTDTGSFPDDNDTINAV